jgi:hypothetical protein
MSKQTDSDTEGMTAEQLAAANERLAKILGVGTETCADDEPTGFITAHPDAPAPPAPARKRRADAGKPNPLRANRKASKYTLEVDLFTPEGRDTLVFWIRQGCADRVIEVVDRLLVDLQELKAARDGEGA